MVYKKEITTKEINKLLNFIEETIRDKTQEKSYKLNEIYNAVMKIRQ